MLYTKDGKSHYIEGDNDFMSLVEDYMGHDAKGYIEETFYTISQYEEAQEDTERYKEELQEEYRDVLVDVRDLADEMLRMLDGRLSKDKMRYKLKRIYDMVNKEL